MASLSDELHFFYRTYCKFIPCEDDNSGKKILDWAHKTRIGMLNDLAVLSAARLSVWTKIVYSVGGSVGSGQLFRSTVSSMVPGIRLPGDVAEIHGAALGHWITCPLGMVVVPPWDGSSVVPSSSTIAAVYVIPAVPLMAISLLATEFSPP